MADRAQLDGAARAQGFKNYEQWAAWDQNTRQQVLQGNPGQPAGEPKNWLQNLLESIPGHPAQTLGYVNERMKKFLGGN